MPKRLEQCLMLIQEYEGFSDVAYFCPAGRLTIGFGFTEGVKLGDTIIREQANVRLERMATELAYRIEALCAPRIPNDNQLSGMVSLVWNIGEGAFAKSTVLRLFKAGDDAGAARAFGLWTKATVNGKKVDLPGLVRRRAAESALFLKPFDTTPEPMPQAIEPEKPLTASKTAIAGGVGAAMVGAQQAIAQVEPVWNGLHALGIRPELVLAIVGVIALGAAVLVVYERIQKRRQGVA